MRAFSAASLTLIRQMVLACSCTRCTSYHAQPSFSLLPPTNAHTRHQSQAATSNRFQPHTRTLAPDICQRPGCYTAPSCFCCCSPRCSRSCLPPSPSASSASLLSASMSASCCAKCAGTALPWKLSSLRVTWMLL